MAQDVMYSEKVLKLSGKVLVYLTLIFYTNLQDYFCLVVSQNQNPDKFLGNFKSFIASVTLLGIHKPAEGWGGEQGGPRMSVSEYNQKDGNNDTK